MVDVPMPELLANEEHADRTIEQTAKDDEQHAAAALQQAREALERTTAYGRDLWNMLAEAADYLRDRGERGAPAGPGANGEADWIEWRDLYAKALDTLSGPRGDSGYGAEQARLIAQNVGRVRPS